MDDFLIENGVLKKYHGSEREVVIPEEVIAIGDGAFAGCKDLNRVTMLGQEISVGAALFDNCPRLEIIIAPYVSIWEFGWSKTVLQAAMGYLTRPELYEDCEFRWECREYVAEHTAEICPRVFRMDLAQGLEIIAELGLITEANLERDYLRPAQAAGAAGCIAFLLDWKHKHMDC